MLTTKTRLTRLTAALLGSIVFNQPTYANLPVFDIGNWVESLKQTYEQVRQSQTQLDQYETQLKNSKTLDNYTWDKANVTMDNLVKSIDTLNYYKQQTGGMDAYLARYQSIDHYRASACFNGAPCTKAQQQAIRQQETNASEAQKRANDALLRGIDQQQTTMQAEARQLIRLQEQAQGATGQMAAIQAANQLASAETNQLLQIRALLVAQQNAEATRAAALADKEAIQAAGDERFRSGSFKKSSGKTW